MKARGIATGMALALGLAAQPAWPQDRLPDIAADKLTDAQKKAAAEFLASRKVPVFGPFVPLLRSPDLMIAAKNMGDYLRYKSVLPLKINEFVILITAREWTQQVEWQIHQPLALKAGLDPAIAEAVAEGRRPETMPEDEALAWEFSMELHRNKSVSDATYAKVVKRFGEQGAVDMAGVNGYYTFLAMSMNMARTPIAAGTQAPLQPLAK